MYQVSSDFQNILENKLGFFVQTKLPEAEKPVRKGEGLDHVGLGGRYKYFKGIISKDLTNMFHDIKWQYRQKQKRQKRESLGDELDFWLDIPSL